MKNKQFDQIIKDRLADHRMPVPGQAWKGVQAGLAARAGKSGRYNSWLAGALLAMLALGGFAWWMLDQDRNAPDNTIETSTQITDPYQDRQEKTYEGLPHEAQTERNLTSEAAEAGNTLSSAFNTSDEEAISAEDRSHRAEGSNDNILDDRGNTDNSTSGIEQTVDANKSTANESGAATAIESGNTGQLTARELNSRENAENALSPEMPQMQSSEINKDRRRTLAESDAMPDRSVSVPDLLTSDKRERNTATGSKMEKLHYNPCMVKTSSDCYSFSPAIKRMYLDLYFGPAYHLGDLTAKHIESVDYAEMRDQTEGYFFSFTAGARASMVWQSGISAGVGLSYTQLGEKFEYTDPDAVRETITNVVVDTIVGTGGNITLVWDTLSVIQHGERLIRQANKYRFLDVPLTVGYEMEGEHFNLSFNGGIMLNLLFSQKGRMLSPSEELVWLQENKDPSYEAYKTNAGISLVGSLGLAYKFRDDLHLLVEPQFRYFLKPLEIGSYPLEHRMKVTSLNLGIRKSF